MLRLCPTSPDKGEILWLLPSSHPLVSYSASHWLNPTRMEGAWETVCGSQSSPHLMMQTRAEEEQRVALRADRQTTGMCP